MRLLLPCVLSSAAGVTTLFSSMVSMSYLREPRVTLGEAYSVDTAIALAAIVTALISLPIKIAWRNSEGGRRLFADIAKIFGWSAIGGLCWGLLTLNGVAGLIASSIVAFASLVSSTVYWAQVRRSIRIDFHFLPRLG